MVAERQHMLGNGLGDCVGTDKAYVHYGFPWELLLQIGFKCLLQTLWFTPKNCLQRIAGFREFTLSNSVDKRCAIFRPLKGKSFRNEDVDEFLFRAIDIWNGRPINLAPEFCHVFERYRFP